MSDYFQAAIDELRGARSDFEQWEMNRERHEMAKQVFRKCERFLTDEELAYLKWELGL